MNVRISKGKARGTVSAPPSKSMAHRLLIAAALSDGSSVSGVAMSEDIKATLGALRTLGAGVEDKGGGVYKLWGLDPSAAKSCTVYCAESGSTLRFMIPLCLLSENEIKLTGTKKLISRPLEEYEELCRRVGLYFSRNEDSVSVRGPLKSGKYKISMSRSSQFVTGLLFALSTLDGKSELEIEGAAESLSYAELTVRAMRAFGADVFFENGTYFINGGKKYEKKEVTVEGDCSNAAFLEALNVLGGKVTVCGISPDTAQGDRVYREYFEMLKRGDSPDLSDCPDLAPVMFGTAAYLGGGHFTGTRRLRFKECDRIDAMKEELAKFGVSLTADENSVTVGGEGIKVPPSDVLSSHVDHRIVMTAALLCTLTGGEIEGAENVKKSYPDFFEVLSSLGIEVSKNTDA